MERRVLAALLVALLLAGCSSIQTLVEKSPETSFKEYGTWEWYPGDPPLTGDPRVDMDERMREYIKSTIEKHLAKRGYERSGFAPDLYVDYHVTLQDMVNSQVINNYYGESYYPDFELNVPGFQDTYQYQWEEGAILIMVFDSNTKELVWRGIARTEVNTQGPRKEARERIDKAVEKLAKELPKT